MRKAINLYDWMDLLAGDALTPEKMLLKPLLTDQVVYCEGANRLDGDGVVAEVDDEHWAWIVKLLRQRYNKNKRRLYQARHSTWERV